MKVCICYYGLTRSLKYTLDSINKNIFDILKLNNIKYDIYLHTYDLEVLTNLRSGEFNCILDKNEYKLLNAKKYIIENQNDFDKKFDYESVKKYGDYWYDDFCSLINLIRQLNSLKNVFKLVEKSEKYTSYIFMRPDLKIFTKLNINDIFQTKTKNIILTPNYAQFRGLNDKFVIGDYNSIKIYANRFDYIYDYMKLKGRLHSESLLKFVIKKFKIRNIYTKIYFARVRANNIIEEKDLKILKNLNVLI